MAKADTHVGASAQCTQGNDVPQIQGHEVDGDKVDFSFLEGDGQRGLTTGVVAATAARNVIRVFGMGALAADLNAEGANAIVDEEILRIGFPKRLADAQSEQGDAHGEGELTDNARRMAVSFLTLASFFWPLILG